MAARKPSGRQPASKAPTARPHTREVIGSVGKPTDLAALARSYAALKQKLADTEAILAREKQERGGDADTIAEMLVRIVALEKAVRATATSDGKKRSMGPSAAHSGAMQRVASLEARADDATLRARTAEAAMADAERRARVARDRIAELTRDQDTLRAALADADARAHKAEDRVAHAEQLARAAKVRATEISDRFEALEMEVISLEARARAAEGRVRDLDKGEPRHDDRELESVRIQLEAAHVARDDARAAIAAEKENTQRELELQRERHAMALRAAHDTYAEAFHDTLEDERQGMRAELEEERARTREALSRVAELEDRLRGADDRMTAALTAVRTELEAMTFDRDAADRQSALIKLQLRAASAKLQLVDKQLERAEESIALARRGASDAIDDIADRIASARGALRSNVGDE